MRTYITILVIAVIVLIAAFGFLYFREQQTASQPIQAVDSLVTATAVGNRNASINAAQTFLRQVSPTDVYYSWGLDVYGQSLYHGATTSAARVKAIDALKTWLALPSATTYGHATAVALMAHLLMWRPDAAAYGAVFADAPLNSLKDADPVKSISNLIDYSIQLRPTYTGYLAGAYQNANIIFENAFGSSVSSDAALKNAAVSAVRDVQLADGSSDAPSENGSRRGPYAISAFAWQKSIEAYALDAATRVDASNFKAASGAYDALIAVANAQSPVLLQRYAANARLAKARFLLSQKIRADEITPLLSALVQQITQKPENYSALYDDFTSAKGATKLSRKVLGASRYSFHRDLIALTAISPELKNFLISQGWTL